MKKVTTLLLSAACVLCLASLVGAQQIPQLNEVVANDPSTDDREYVEICADPNTDLSAFTVIIIEGDSNSSGRGQIDRVWNLTGLVGASGYYTVGGAAACDQNEGTTNLIENGAGTVLLVRNFTGALNDDLDVDNDGVEDGPFPGMIVDGVATKRPSAGDSDGYYGVVTLGPDTGDDGTSDFDPAGVARCTDCDGDWGMLCLAGNEGAPVCNTNYVATAASPCADNLCHPVAVEQSSWGKIKAEYR